MLLCLQLPSLGFLSHPCHKYCLSMALPGGTLQTGVDPSPSKRQAGLGWVPTGAEDRLRVGRPLAQGHSGPGPGDTNADLRLGPFFMCKWRKLS